MLHFDVEPRVGYLYTTLTGGLSLAAATPADRNAFGAFLATEVQRAARLFSSFPRIAIYAVAPLMDPNRYTQTVAANRGAQVRASDSMQELTSWLGV